MLVDKQQISAKQGFTVIAICSSVLAGSY